jgi:hypothetical protein
LKTSSLEELKRWTEAISSSLRMGTGEGAEESDVVVGKDRVTGFLKKRGQLNTAFQQRYV